MKRNRDFENEKIERLYVTREMAEDKEMDEKIRQDLIRAADEAEKASQEEEALGTSIPMGAKEKQQLFDDIVDELKRKGIWEEDPEETDGDRPEQGTLPCPARPEDQLSAEDQEALRLGRKLLHTPQKKKSTILPKILKGITGAAVVALGVFVLSMSSEANRVKLLSVWNSVVKDELRIDIDSENNIQNIKEEEAYNVIKEILGISPARLLYRPQSLVYSDCEIDETAKIANLYYLYNDTIISICMYGNGSEAKRSLKFDGSIVDLVNVNSDEKIAAKIWSIRNEKEETYLSEFEYKEAYYLIWASMNKKEFEKMISNIAF